MSTNEDVSATDRETELRRLRERVYGPGAVPDAADIARLHELEANPEAAAVDVLFGARAAEDADDAGMPAGDALPAPTAASPGRTKPARRAVALLAVSMAFAIVVAGAIGFILGSASRPDATQRFYPELAGAQSALDIIPDLGVTEFDAESARFVANVENVAVYVAAPAAHAGICLIIEEATAQGVSWTSGCSYRDAPNAPLSVTGTDGKVFSVGESPGSHEGEPLRLSENITVYIPERGSPAN